MFSTRSHAWLPETCVKRLLLSPSHDHQNHIQTAASQHCSLGTCSGQALFSIAGHTAQTTQSSSRGEMCTLPLADGPIPDDTSSPSVPVVPSDHCSASISPTRAENWDMGEANRSEVASPTVPYVGPPSGSAVHLFSSIFAHTFSCDRLTGTALTGPLCHGFHWPAVYTVTLDSAQVLQPNSFTMETAAQIHCPNPTN